MKKLSIDHTQPEFQQAVDAITDIFAAYPDKCELCQKDMWREGVSYNGKVYGPSCYDKLMKRISLRQQGNSINVQQKCESCGQLFLLNPDAKAWANVCPTDKVCCSCCMYSTGKIPAKYCPVEDVIREDSDLSKKYGITPKRK